jgi:hypothetical protein
MHDLRDVGGTRGGLGQFLVGLGMLVAGLYLLFLQVDVDAGYWRSGWGGERIFGLSLLPLLAGIGWMFWDSNSKGGWLLAGGGLLIITVGIIANMQIHFRRTNLFNTLTMLVLIAGGIGLVARSMRDNDDGKSAGDDPAARA